MNKPGVIVFGGTCTALAVIRALGQKGIPIIAADYSRFSAVFSSKYVEKCVVIPNPAEASEAVVSFLMRHSNEWKDKLLIPTDDYILATLSKNKDMLSKHYCIAAADWGVIEKCLDKKLTVETAIEASVPTPKTLFVDSVSTLRANKGTFSYPCILKPLDGKQFTERFRSKVFQVSNFEDLEFYYELANSLGYDVMVQEIVPGADDQLFTYYAYRDLDGNTLAEFTCRKIRQLPAVFGVITYGESTHTPELHELGRRFMDQLNFSGIGGIEFKLDQYTNEFKLIEINARFGMVTGLPSAAGVNFPWVLYQYHNNCPEIGSSDYIVGQKWVYMYWDLVTSIAYYPNNRNLLKILRFWKQAQAHAWYQHNDVKPFVIDCILYSLHCALFLIKYPFRKWTQYVRRKWH